MTERNRQDSSRFKADLQDFFAFRNDSGEAIPAYGCIKILSYDAANDMYTVDKPDGAEGLYFVNGPVPVAASKKGRGTLWARAQIGLVDDGALGDEVGPVNDSWEMATTSSIGGFRIFNNPVSGRAVLLQVGGGGSAGTIDVLVGSCLGRGYYNATVAVWTPSIPVSSGSGSGGSGSAGSSAEGCDPCDALDTITDFECGDTGEPDIPRDTPTDTGVPCIIYDPFPLPLKQGKHAICALPGVPYTSGSGSGSGSGGSSGVVYKVLNGKYRTVVIPHEKWECCTDPNTGVQTVQRVACTSFITLGVACEEPPTPCSSGGSGSV